MEKVAGSRQISGQGSLKKLPPPTPPVRQ
jgi:hypothetical protein